MIGNPIDVHCSVLLRRVLMDHQKLHPNTTNSMEEHEGNSHHILIGRLEACHCYYLLLAGDEQGLTWQWKSRLSGEGASVAANAAAAAARATAVVVPGNVNCLIKGEFLEDVFGSDFEVGDGNSPLRGHKCDLGNEFDNEVDGENDWGGETAASSAGEGIDDCQSQNDKGAENDDGKETAVSSGKGNDDSHEQNDNEMEDVATNEHTAEGANNDSNEAASDQTASKDDNHQHSSNETEEDAATDKGSNDKNSNEAAPGKRSNNAVAPPVEHGETEVATDDHTAEKEGNNGHTNNEAAAGQTTAAPVEQGNVAELFENLDNFDEIEDMFDLSSSNDASHLPLDGASDGITVAGTSTGQQKQGSAESAEPTVDGGKEPPADVMAMAFPPLADHDSFLENGVVAADSITVAGTSMTTGQQQHGREMAESTVEEEEPTTAATGKKMAEQSSSTAQVGQQQQSGDNARTNGTGNETSQLSQESISNAASFVGIDDMMEDDSEEEEEGSEKDKEDCQKESNKNDVEPEEPLLSQPRNKNNGTEDPHNDLFSPPDESMTNAHDEDDGEEDHSQILLSQVSNIGHTTTEDGGLDAQPESESPLPAKQAVKERSKALPKKSTEEEEDIRPSESQIPFARRKKQKPKEKLNADDHGPIESQIPLVLTKGASKALPKKNTEEEEEEEEEEGLEKDEEQCKTSNKNDGSQEPLLTQPDESITNNHGDEDGGEEDHSPILLSQVSNTGHATTTEDSRQNGRSESQFPLPAKRATTKARPLRLLNLPCGKKQSKPMEQLNGGDEGHGPALESQIPLSATTKAPRHTRSEQQEEEKVEKEEAECGPESQIPLSTRKTAPETMGLLNEDDDEDHRPATESQIPLITTRKASKKALQKKGREDEDEGIRRESQIHLPLRKKKSKPMDKGEKKNSTNRRRKVFDQLTFADPPRPRKSSKQPPNESNDEHPGSQPLNKKQRSSPSYTSRFSRRDFYDSDGDPSDDWMRVVRATRSKSKLSKSSTRSKSKKKVPPAAAMQKTNVADDESTNEPLLESQMAAGEGSEESHVLPTTQSQSPRQNHGSSKKKSTTAKCRRRERVGSDDGGGGAALSPQSSIHSEDDLLSQEETTRQQQKQRAPLTTKSNHNSAGGDGYHHRVRFAVKPFDNDPFDKSCDVSSTGAKAATLRGTPTTRKSISAAYHGSDDEEEESNTIDNSKNSNKARRKKKRSKAGNSNEVDMVSIIKRAKRLCGL